MISTDPWRQQRDRELRAAIKDSPRRPQHAVVVETKKPETKKPETRRSRDGFKVGDIRKSDPEWPCSNSKCGLIRDEQLDDITEKGGQTWTVLKCGCRLK